MAEKTYVLKLTDTQMNDVERFLETKGLSQTLETYDRYKAMEEAADEYANNSDVCNSANRLVNMSADRGPNNSADRGPNNSADRGPNNSADRGPNNSADRGPNNSAYRGPNNTADRGPNSSAHRADNNSADRADNSSADRADNSSADMRFIDSTYNGGIGNNTYSPKGKHTCTLVKRVTRKTSKATLNTNVNTGSDKLCDY